jgi:GR25 family glycosyltransferase involved in LPS biosynthesis
MKENKTFDIYVINLDKDKDRLAKMKHRLGANKFTRIPGIYGNDYDYSNDVSVSYTCKHICPKSVIGCALSHRLALKTFIETSKKDYLLLLEDDAEPIHKNFIEKTEQAIHSAPANWDVIKLDWLWSIWKDTSFYSEKKFNISYSGLATALIINKKGAKQILKNKIHWHYDSDIYFYGIKVYNNPERVFKQTWNADNNSNNRLITSYPAGNDFLEALNFKIVRLFGQEFTWNDLIYFLLFVILFCVIYRYYSMKTALEKIKAVLSIQKT